jgi:hypothetical protein
MEFDHVEKELVQKRDEETGEGIYEFDAQAVIQAASWIGKHRKMFTEKVEVSLSEGFAERLKRAREKVKRG